MKTLALALVVLALAGCKSTKPVPPNPTVLIIELPRFPDGSLWHPIYLTNLVINPQ